MMYEKNKIIILPMSLQLFAEGGGGGEKTEKATPRKKEKAREEGQVAKSNEITTTFMLVIMFSSIKILGPDIIDRTINLMEEIANLFGTREVTPEFAKDLMQYVLIEGAFMIVPLCMISFTVAFLANVFQVGWKPNMKPMQPKLSNISPISGLKRMFSLKTLVELIKSIIKIGIILIIVYFSLREYENLIYLFYELPVLKTYALIMDIALDLGIRIGSFFMIVAVIDFIYQKFSLAKKLKMSKQEIKDEYKLSEGNPEIKSKIKQRMREASMRRMMQDLPKADVVITNPTHFAVAIKYDEQTFGAPYVLAKGADIMAGRIKSKASELNIQIVENKPLARTLYYTVEIGDEVPPELYQTVAEVLAFVYNLKNSQKEGARV
ncbi:flagellar biosynthesis protein FlhB [Petrocella sp. FN5]|uniref:flagellar biosynthesis protein FlhB n=1 Tax=Petrocella sp. FN5 TaxID=3032002 RepID=UPI0023DB56DD|nr:flagellar biosynthesis protein FlhB [Petrocella sp. FN5]MDF1616811.1 flagellar biosynthesis protein FlhB [Petrocella sp. FN5]